MYKIIVEDIIPLYANIEGTDIPVVTFVDVNYDLYKNSFDESSKPLHLYMQINGEQLRDWMIEDGILDENGLFEFEFWDDQERTAIRYSKCSFAELAETMSIFDDYVLKFLNDVHNINKANLHEQILKMKQELDYLKGIN